MDLPAPIAVAVEVRLLDTGPLAGRVWRTSHAIGERGVGFARDLPFEPGRLVQVDLKLPFLDGDVALTATGRVDEPRAVAFTALDADDRRVILRYVTERTSP